MTHFIDQRQALSPHFTLKEFTRSEAANKHQLYNVPREESEIANLRALALKVLEPAREILNKPLIITSGFRCGTLNRLIGGAAQSQHMYGEAADFIVRGLSMFDAAITLAAQDSLPFDQLIYEIRVRQEQRPLEWLHVSHKRLGGNRHEVLTVYVDNDQRETQKGILSMNEFNTMENNHAA